MIAAGNVPLTVNYYIAGVDEGDIPEASAHKRFAGPDTFLVGEQIENQGESLTVIRYDPLPKPGRIQKGQLVSFQQIDNRNIAEWVNPNNRQVGYRAVEYKTKGFVGDHELQQNVAYAVANREPLTLTYHDVEKVLLPSHFEGFDPGPLQELVHFGQVTPGREAYQQTQWTVLRRDGEYALSNIQRIKYFRGQFLYSLADLHRVHYPGGASTTGFLPWNQLYDEDGKIIDYVPSWSADVVEEPYIEEPYLGQSDGYVEPCVPPTDLP